MNTPNPFRETLAAYERANTWILGRITDPLGKRHFADKPTEVRFDEVIARFERLGVFLKSIGNPHHQYKSIHVAGTSGKGSVTTMTAAILTAVGVRTGYHVSPYFQTPLEKLVINGKMASPSSFVAAVERFKAFYNAAPEPLTYGETWVALTYDWFAQQQTDWLVMETGVGGRYDLSNVLPADISIVTNISYDHVNFLGPTLENIAWHKAGIIKPGQNAVTGVTAPELLSIFEKEAQEQGVNLWRLGKEVALNVHEFDQQGARFSVRTPFAEYNDLHIPQQGQYQPMNAALAVAAADLAREHHGIPLTTEAINAGLAAAHIPGRTEVIQRDPLVILDGAHNPAKIRALMDSVRRLYPDKRVGMVFGALFKKDASAMIAEFASHVDWIVATEPKVFGKPAQPAAALADILRTHTRVPIHTEPNLNAALDHALARTAPDDVLIITGSIYLVGNARERWVPTETLLVEAERGFEKK